MSAPLESFFSKEISFLKISSALPALNYSTQFHGNCMLSYVCHLQLAMMMARGDEVRSRYLLLTIAIRNFLEWYRHTHTHHRERGRERESKLRLNFGITAREELFRSKNSNFTNSRGSEEERSGFISDHAIAFNGVQFLSHSLALRSSTLQASEHTREEKRERRTLCNYAIKDQDIHMRFRYFFSISENCEFEGKLLYLEARAGERNQNRATSS
jgi:hypothetical protein